MPGNIDVIPIDECARHLARLRSGHPRARFISNLIGQLKGYADNPNGLRPRIIASVEQIEAAASDQ